MKLIYATDLDRTLIYSNRFIDEYNVKSKYIGIESKNNINISNISVEVYDRLHELLNNKNIIFIPTTTRSIEQYKRIKLNVNNKYAITTNGGIILEDGAQLTEWNNIIESKLDFNLLNECVNYLNGLDCVNSTVSIVDNRFVFTKVDDINNFNKYKKDIENKYGNQLDIITYSNKVYLMPKVFNKAIALEWLKNRVGADVIVSSGDTNFDIPMLNISDYSVIPSHGAIVNSNEIRNSIIAHGDINSPLVTIELVKEKLRHGSKY